MKKVLIATLLLLISFSCKKEVSEKVEKKAILAVMKAQETAWSNHNLEGYMQGYWKSDSLKFYGSNGLTYGWNKTLSNYKKGYPTKDHSGVLKFKVNDISKITNGAYFVMGEYHLTRKVGNAKGVFMIIFKKIKNQWKIIADTSC
ncbi:nuclear transport factor 2 family protein [Tenacibaculum finnmarkense]|uniref:nuclear transport factor 2 family protein n=1 Tax=Tenacibaculum finnmarkense TaxID=2781243 RepID=UPI001EFAA0B1|nr:nuclear transport factor 2 family protein [Tenacibaculum finnmarkense]MCG8893002.1 nuclear transport factor 2 family protein [Tenacibaculum finnmarkense]MCG8901510.1 nuclear transport factor 2 family protein [Tenacibaculum finnmarkense]